MNPVFSNALQHLRDVHAPSAPSGWPPAPGWWLLLVLLLLIATSFALRARRTRGQRAIYVAALAELRSIRAAAEASEMPRAASAQSVSLLLRRLALAAGHAAAALPVEALPMLLFGRELQPLGATLGQRFAPDNFSTEPSSQAEAWQQSLASLQRELERAARR